MATKAKRPKYKPDFDIYDRKWGLLSGSGSSATPDQYEYGKTKGGVVARDPYSNKVWDSQSRQWSDPNAPVKKKSRGRKVKLGKMSNYEWTMFRARPPRIPGALVNHPSQGIANRLLETFGTDIDKIPTADVNKMLNIFATRRPGGPRVTNPGYGIAMQEYYDQKYFKPAELYSENRMKRSRARDYFKKLAREKRRKSKLSERYKSAGLI